ncbi:NAD(P)-dependent oxidoreductase [Marinospirillum sp. MEB164]|uniref:NAD(P)-dependent oxidoreductase n=1 Tax=Marinospirillum alkalitolerans TaxID=3123374 RepID=A0ABW8PZ92_9GAMM
MNLTLIGASGFIGSALLNEALTRGHQVTALVRHPQKLAPHPLLQALPSDVLDTATLSEQLRGADLVISAFSGHAQEDVYGYYVRGFESILAATQAAGVPRLMLVGGAASLEVAPGQLLLDSPDFPAAYRATAEGAKTALERLRAQQTQNWTLISPAAEIFPGERTGQFRLGQDQLLVDAKGQSRISVEDYAVAFLDEAETAQHAWQRMSVAY